LPSSLQGSLPSMVAHADWGINPNKRWMARATLQDGRYVAHAPEPVGDTSTLVHRLRLETNDDATVLVGFDFPIGLPIEYAKKADVQEFLALLPELGHGEWSDFYRVAERPDQISLQRPFYPQRPGGTKMRHLLDALDMESSEYLLRRCDKAHGDRQAAAPIFWTMGAKQVGKAAISGWRDLLAPALRSPDLDVAVWPFDGTLNDLLQQRRTVIAETYPAEFYRHLELNVRSKRDQVDRQANASTLLRWANENNIVPSREMRSTIEDGFGPLSDGDDRFDAAVGLFGMLNIVFGHRASGEPEDGATHKVEGWMLGQLANPNE
jgi:hypothetical protein